MCTINKSAHTKKSLETYLMIHVNLLTHYEELKNVAGDKDEMRQ